MQIGNWGHNPNASSPAQKHLVWLKWPQPGSAAMCSSLQGCPSRTEPSAASEGESPQVPELQRFIVAFVYDKVSVRSPGLSGVLLPQLGPQAWSTTPSHHLLISFETLGSKYQA